MQRERRRSQRIHTYQPVRLQPVHSQRSTDTLTKDISAHGVRCLSGQIFPVSTELSVELSTKEGPMAAYGKAAWFQMIPHSDQVEIGITFTDVSPETMQRLSVYLDHLSIKSVASEAS